MNRMAVSFYPCAGDCRSGRQLISPAATIFVLADVTTQNWSMPRSKRCASEAISGESVFGDNLAFDEVLLDDLFEDFGSAGVIPDGFGIDDGDGASGADAEAIDFAAIDERFRAGQVEFFEPPF